MRGFFKAIWRQRRRVLTGVFGLLFLGMIFANSEIGGFEGIPAWALGLGLAIMAPLIAAPIILLIMVIPSIRNVIECLVVALLIEAAILAAFPGLAQTLQAWDIGAILWLIIWLSVYFFLYGSLSDRLPSWFSYTGRSRFTTTAAPQDVINAATPTPDAEEAYYTGAMEYLGPDPLEEDSFNVRYNIGESLYEHQRITILEHQPGKRCRYYFMGDVSAKNADFAEGVFDVTATALPNGKTRVEIVEERPHLRLRHALWNWFDDSVADGADALRAKLEGRRDWSFSGRFWRKVAKLA
ncbi:hypothetical protein [uncultured Litoreibacter sp.]|uniref:hypothetical protein n=1 Tax=uncultured Litoreibacter sp. TaxID=1392394 RepID=UPI0026238031|nr:hypothetical protein [uncultured Litoreibacter sp.]